jgi:hypothetical protein
MGLGEVFINMTYGFIALGAGRIIGRLVGMITKRNRRSK